jgi:hypothetical protein
MEKRGLDRNYRLEEQLDLSSVNEMVANKRRRVAGPIMGD